MPNSDYSSGTIRAFQDAGRDLLSRTVDEASAPSASPLAPEEAVAVSVLARHSSTVRDAVPNFSDPLLRQEAFTSLYATPAAPLFSWVELEFYRDALCSPVRLRTIFPLLMARHQAFQNRYRRPDALYNSPGGSRSLTLTAQMAFDADNLSRIAHALGLVRPELELRSEHVELHDAANEHCWCAERDTYNEPSAAPWLLLGCVATPERAEHMLTHMAPGARATPLPPVTAIYPLYAGLNAFGFRTLADAFAGHVLSALLHGFSNTGRLPAGPPFSMALLATRLPEIC